MDFWNEFEIGIYIGMNSINSIEAEAVEETQNLNFEKQHKLTENQKQQLEECVNLFKKAEPGTIGHTTLMEYKIDTGNSPPIRSKSHPWSPYIEREINQEVDRMISLGVIERSCSAWGHPIVPVRKATRKMRLFLDSRKLNAVTAHDPYPLPHLHRILGRLEKSTFLSSIDLSDAFWQIPLDAESREKTAFIVPSRGLYQFTRLPFGVKNSPMVLVRLMDRVLDQGWEPNVFVYLDDIIICSDTFEEHCTWIRKVVRDLLTKYEVDHWLNPAYHPQVNPAERVNTVVVSALKSYVGEDQRNWDTQVGRIEAAINSSVHVSTGFTPFYVEHGREMPLSGQEHKVLRHIGKIDPRFAEENRLKTFGKLHTTVKQNIKKVYEG
jgi:Reverse transcriptase (RNA-dependent DNA polymerase)